MGRRRLAGAVLLAALGFAVPAGAQDFLPPAQDRYFRVEFEAWPRPGGARLVGSIHNGYGAPAMNVRLLVEALDASGRVTGSVTRPLAGTVPAFGRRDFDVTVPAAPAYRVRLSHWDWIRGGGS